MFALDVAAADREDQHGVAGAEARALEPRRERRLPAFVVGPGGQLGDVVGRRVGLEPQSLRKSLTAWLRGRPSRRRRARTAARRRRAPRRARGDRARRRRGRARRRSRRVSARYVVGEASVMRLVGDPADGEGVQAELVAMAPDLARAEAGRDQQRPEVARVVVALVVVHLLGRAQAEAERRELEGALAAPRRHVDEQTPPGASTRRNSRERGQRLRRGARAPRGTARRRATRPASSGSTSGSGPRSPSPCGCAFEVVGERDVDEDTPTRPRRASDAREACLVAAAEVAEALRRRSCPSAPNGARAKPDAEAVDRRR